MKFLRKKGFEFTVAKLVTIIIAIIFLVVAIKIIFDVKTKGFDILESIKNLFVFGP